MANTQYVITDTDWPAARTYLQRKLALDAAWLEPERAVKAEASFTTDSRDPVTLTQWCERWLDSEHWQQRKAAIRAARRRRRLKSSLAPAPVQVTLSYQAHRVLTGLAKCEGITLSDFILKHHDAAWGEWLQQQYGED